MAGGDRHVKVFIFEAANPHQIGAGVQGGVKGFFSVVVEVGVVTDQILFNGAKIVEVFFSGVLVQVVNDAFLAFRNRHSAVQVGEVNPYVFEPPWGNGYFNAGTGLVNGN